MQLGYSGDWWVEENYLAQADWRDPKDRFGCPWDLDIYLKIQRRKRFPDRTDLTAPMPTDITTSANSGSYSVNPRIPGVATPIDMEANAIDFPEAARRLGLESLAGVMRIPPRLRGVPSCLPSCQAAGIPTASNGELLAHRW